MANLSVNAVEWNSISAEDQTRITTILKTSGLLGQTDKIEGHPEAPTIAMLSSSTMKPQSIFCKIGCDLAEAGAVAACSVFSGPALAICIAAAHAGGELCRSKC